MTKWKNLAGKFTDEQIELIEKFQEKYGLNSNQLIQISILFMILFTEIMLEFSGSKFPETLELKYKKIKKEISKFPALNEQIQPFLKEIDQNLNKTLRDVTGKKVKEFNSFTERRKIGRPKAAKKPPGRPKDKGI